MSFLQKKIFDVFPSSFGLDLSDLSIKVLRMEREGSVHKVNGFASAALPIGSVIDGEILKPEVVVDVMRRLLEEPAMKKMHTRRVVCSLPETKAFLRVISLPLMEEKEVREAIRWEIEANIPLTLDQVYYDWQILGDTLPTEKGKMNILFVAVARTVVDQFVGALEAAGLDVVGLETESIAQARSLLSEADEKKTTLTVDIGDRRTSLLVSVGNTPCFTSSVPLSSQMITDSIAKYLRISFQEAEDIKIKQETINRLNFDLNNIRRNHDESSESLQEKDVIINRLNLDLTNSKNKYNELEEEMEEREQQIMNLTQ